MITKFSSIIAATFLLFSCTHTQSEQQSNKEQFTKGKKKHSRFKKLKKIVTSSSSSCIKTSTNGNSVLPITLKNMGIVVTKINKPCKSESQVENGFSEESNYSVMEVPCLTGGKIFLAGSYGNPKQISFPINQGCGRRYQNKNILKVSISKLLNFPQTMPLVANNSFTVHFWEAPGFIDSDVGDTIKLKTYGARKAIWKKLTNQASQKFILYGKENSWSSKKFYKIEANMFLSAYKDFKLIIENLTLLSSSDLDLLRQKCQKLRPMRRCSTYL